MSIANKLPVIFLSHGGGPAAFLNYAGSGFGGIDKSSPSAAFMKTLSTFVKGEVKNILVVSAHWEERQFTVGYNDKGTKLLYDYSGFPKEAYAPYLTYPAPTDLNLANRVQELLSSAGLQCGKQDRGFDHGTFIPLKLAYPDANVPVVQLSLKSNLSPAEHIRLGEVLAPLRSEGTLILCSGQITHNFEFGQGRDSRTVAFTEWIRSHLENTNAANYAETKAAFIAVERDCPHFHWAHPRSEHFTPLFVALGTTAPTTSCSADNTAANTDNNSAQETSIRRIYAEIVMGTMAVDTYLLN